MSKRDDRLLFDLVRLTGMVMEFDRRLRRQLMTSKRRAVDPLTDPSSRFFGQQIVNLDFQKEIGEVLPYYTARYSSMTKRPPKLVVDNTKQPKGKA